MRPPSPLIDLSLSLPADLHEWITHMAKQMGLPDPESYILLLLRLEKQRQDLAGVAERYDQIFRPGSAEVQSALNRRKAWFRPRKTVG
jgi:hypothetical protein